MYKIGLDIGSTASKIAVLKENVLVWKQVMPTGWSGKEVSKDIEKLLEKEGIPILENVIATGYGRISVPYAVKNVTEITCHAKGVQYLFEESATVVDIGGQDTKVITLKNGQVTDFTMNDKCSAGTGKFLEVMANRMGVGISQLCQGANYDTDLRISAMCTVFAESEVISFIGRGMEKADISAAILHSILDKVKSLVTKHGGKGPFYLTGGLCEEEMFLQKLGEKLGKEVKSSSEARFAGAIGAALLVK